MLWQVEQNTIAIKELSENEVSRHLNLKYLLFRCLEIIYRNGCTVLVDSGDRTKACMSNNKKQFVPTRCTWL